MSPEIDALIATVDATTATLASVRAQLIAMRERTESKPPTIDASNPATWPTRKTCGLPPTTVDRLRERGDLRVAKIGRELRINPEDLARVLASSVVTPKNTESAPEQEAHDMFERARQRARSRRAA